MVSGKFDGSIVSDRWIGNVDPSTIWGVTKSEDGKPRYIIH